MPNVQSLHTTTLKLAAKVTLPPATKITDEKGRVTIEPGEAVAVTKEAWAKCCADKHTRQFMARGLVRLAAASPKPKAKPASKPTSKPPKGK